MSSAEDRLNALVLALVGVLAVASAASAQLTDGNATGDAGLRHRMFATDDDRDRDRDPDGAERRRREAEARAVAERAVELPEGPVDPHEYRVGPGDVLLFVVSGAAEVLEEIPIDPEGRVFVPNVGVVDVAHRTLESTRETIRGRAGEIYSNVTIDVLLARMRQFKVHVVGATSVMFPGSYPATATTRVSEAVAMAGGLTEGASGRRVRMHTASGTVEADIVGFVLTGRLDLNPHVVDGAVIEVVPRTESVLLSGEVQHPGNYEPLPGERLSEMLSAVGGFTAAADSHRVVLSRFVSHRETEERTFAYVPGGDDASDPILLDGDRVYVRPIPDWHRGAEVFVYGAVQRPGRYPISPAGTPLSTVVAMAGGVTVRANLDQGHVMRPREKPTPPSVELSDILENRDDVELQTAVDSILVASDFRAALMGRDDDEDVMLYDGDVVQIPEDRAEVRVIGRVRAPGSYAYVPGRDVGDYVALAGGYDKDADKGRTRVAPFFGGPLRKARDDDDVRSGTVIHVPTKEKISTWQRAREATALVVQIASLVVLVDRLVGN